MSEAIEFRRDGEFSMTQKGGDNSGGYLLRNGIPVGVFWLDPTEGWGCIYEFDSEKEKNMKFLDELGIPECRDLRQLAIETLWSKRGNCCIPITDWRHAGAHVNNWPPL